MFVIITKRKVRNGHKTQVYGPFSTFEEASENTESLNGDSDVFYAEPFEMLDGKLVSEFARTRKNLIEKQDMAKSTLLAGKIDSMSHHGECGCQLCLAR